MPMIRVMVEPTRSRQIVTGMPGSVFTPRSGHSMIEPRVDARRHCCMSDECVWMVL